MNKTIRPIAARPNIKDRRFELKLRAAQATAIAVSWSLGVSIVLMMVFTTG
ncbi:hypothetical protein [Brevundimonas sp. TWP2-3-2]|uniref:hypothetical protein n=1 Tax=unclassified Brevundimonas TaxID=2622653 RepID=UPI003CF2B6D8